MERDRGWSEYTRTGPPTVTDAVVSHRPPAWSSSPWRPIPPLPNPFSPRPVPGTQGAGAPAATAPGGLRPTHRRRVTR